MAPDTCPDPCLYPQTDLRVGHSSDVHDLAFSPDGRLLATPSDDCTVKLWDAATGRLLHTLVTDDTPLAIPCAPGEFGPRECWLARAARLAFSPDGEALLTAQDGELRFWNAATGRLQGSRQVEHFVAACSPDTRLVLSGSADGTIEVWDPALRKPLATLVALLGVQGNAPGSECLAFTPDGYVTRSEAAPGWIQCGVGHQVFPLAPHAERRRPALVARALRAS